MPASFANSYIVNTEEDASHLRNLFTVHKRPQPIILVYPLQSEGYHSDNPLLSEALNKEKPVIANLITDHFGHRFVTGIKIACKLCLATHIYIAIPLCLATHSYIAIPCPIFYNR